ncbi:MAG TPA: hypothetical protein VJX95_01260 [Oscillospiraceae bacterium]|nr:hypothetical protein [Oscillospiraceae bacterium]
MTKKMLAGFLSVTIIVFAVLTQVDAADEKPLPEKVLFDCDRDGPWQGVLDLIVGEDIEYSDYSNYNYMRVDYLTHESFEGIGDGEESWVEINKSIISTTSPIENQIVSGAGAGQFGIAPNIRNSMYYGIGGVINNFEKNLASIMFQKGEYIAENFFNIVQITSDSTYATIEAIILVYDNGSIDYSKSQKDTVLFDGEASAEADENIDLVTLYRNASFTISDLLSYKNLEITCMVEPQALETAKAGGGSPLMQGLKLYTRMISPPGTEGEQGKDSEGIFVDISAIKAGEVFMVTLPISKIIDQIVSVTAYDERYITRLGGVEDFLEAIVIQSAAVDITVTGAVLTIRDADSHPSNNQDDDDVMNPPTNAQLTLTVAPAMIFAAAVISRKRKCKTR